MSVFDLSEAGTRFAVKAALPASQSIEITFSEPSLGRPIKRFATVVRSWAHDDGTSWVVATFDRRLDYAELQRLV
jgi:hypothetical protein